MNDQSTPTESHLGFPEQPGAAPDDDGSGGDSPAASEPVITKTRKKRTPKAKTNADAINEAPVSNTPPAQPKGRN